MGTGIWPESARIAKEFTATNGVTPGAAVIESHNTGLSLIIKENSRFPAETAISAISSSGTTASPMRQPPARCSACHEGAASGQQYIFADHHIGLHRN